MPFQRPHVEILKQRFSEEPNRLIAVSGPRQTGKTTAAHQALESVRHCSRFVAVDEPESLTVPGPSSVSQPNRRRSAPESLAASRPSTVGTGSFTSEATRRDSQWLVRIWEESREEAWNSERSYVLVLDEIQKITGWSEVVKGLWDADRASGCPLHVVILGSSPLLMQDGLTESLAGRFESIRFTHWSYPEMSEAFGFDWERFVFFGGYPGAAHLIQNFEDWSSYIRDALIKPNIERDVLSMTRIDKPALLKRLLDMGAIYSGQELSYNKMVGQLQDAGNTTTLARYLKLLADAGLLTGLSKHKERLVSAKASTPKLNVFNTAVMTVALGYTFEEARADRSHWGRMVESAIGAHLVNTASPNTTVKYWRDGTHEVDFVLHRGPHLIGVEVKSGRIRRAASGLAKFKQRFKASTVLTVGVGTNADVTIDEFLSHPADHWIDTA